MVFHKTDNLTLKIIKRLQNEPKAVASPMDF